MYGDKYIYDYVKKFYLFIAPKPMSAAAAILANKSDDKQRFDSADWASSLQSKKEKKGSGLGGAKE